MSLLADAVSTVLGTIPNTIASDKTKWMGSNPNQALPPTTLFVLSECQDMEITGLDWKKYAGTKLESTSSVFKGEVDKQKYSTEVNIAGSQKYKVIGEREFPITDENGRSYSVIFKEIQLN